jgi:polysaccharide chain length determinant protein (PEP-CTERM system associated)
MIKNRLQDLDDYLGILRRHAKLIVILAISTTAVGFLVSFFVSPEYKSRSLVLVEKQTIPPGYVRPIITTASIDRLITLQRQVLSKSRLQPVVERLGLARKGRTVAEAIEQIQKNTSITEADSSAFGPMSRRSNDFPGFFVNFIAQSPNEAQQICSEVTAMLLSENLKMREQVALGTTGFLSRQLAEAKKNLDDNDSEFAAFQSRYLGQLPRDSGNNLKILEGLNSELDANTQALNRAQQDKSYTQSVLDQQLAGWRSSQTSLTAETIGQRLVTLNTQLIALQARYTDKHPAVIKMKKDIAALEAKQKEMNAAVATEDSADNMRPKAEPLGILQLRQQIHQNENVISRATAEEKRLQALIETYQGRLTLSPNVEQQYAKLTRDNEVAHKLYDSLLVNKSESEEQTDLEHGQQGEQMKLLDPASLPDAPSFPIRWKFAGGGFGAGLAAALGFAFLVEIRDKGIRDEKDISAALELPMLALMRWVPSEPAKHGTEGKGRFGTLFGQ